MYLFDHVPKRNEICLHFHNRNDDTPLIRTERYENSFFPYTILEWTEMDAEVKPLLSIQTFKRYLNDFIRPPWHSVYGISDKSVIKFLNKFELAIYAIYARVVSKMKHQSFSPTLSVLFISKFYTS